MAKTVVLLGTIDTQQLALRIIDSKGSNPSNLVLRPSIAGTGCLQFKLTYRWSWTKILLGFPLW